MIEAEIRDLIALARQSELTEKDWFELLERRRRLVKDYLHDMTLKTLEAVNFYCDYLGNQCIRSRGEPGFFIPGGTQHQETRGIFPNDDCGVAVSCVDYRFPANPDTRDPATNLRLLPDEIHRFWGLTRNNEWIGIEVEIKKHYEPYKCPDRFQEVARATRMQAKEYSPEALCQFTRRNPKELWLRLGEAMRQWAGHREALYETARGLAEKIERQEEFLRLAFPG